MRDENIPCFDAVYTFDGRVFIKKKFSDNKEDALCIGTRDAAMKIIEEYKKSTSATNNDD